MISFDLTGKTAIVTGASQGIGLELATTMAEAGANVAMLARREDVLQVHAAEIAAKTGKKVIGYHFDASEFDTFPQVVSKILEDFGTIEILVNNAAIHGHGAVRPEELTPESWSSILNVNLTGMLFLSTEVYRQYMKEHGGRIVNVASMAGVRTSTTDLAYSVSKAGVIQLTKNLPIFWASEKIFVNAVAPGYIINGGMNDGHSVAFREYVRDAVAQKQLGDYGDMSGIVIFLASDANRYIQGQTVTVDGGLLLRT